ncbi:MutT:nudix family protein [Planococcus halocryophilus Or1]|uniref:DNA mismatch repair protein MutT n=1 Tax=Planococcus halocryophilus TaxID=1215089 RepID=A0A1C7DPW2_9BACL|nr:NUDIX domain-containing protein [Planococcus halocryophilus]ANU13253.1 DNA mismatch repair protein MutT [Planococcus halocryophilus]EMF45267.1 MutT:nudix family protein [Planococcus halocryophilus Or1]
MRDSARVILIKNSEVAFIERVKNGDTYFVFPGGGIKKGETPKEAAKREALEETGLEVEILECLKKVEWNGTHYFFRATITGGNFGSGLGAEFVEEKRARGTYRPVWLNINILDSLDIRPRSIMGNIKNL